MVIDSRLIVTRFLLLTLCDLCISVQWVRRWNSSLLGHDRQIAIVNFDWLIWSVFPDPDLFRRGPASNFPVIQSITTISNGKGNGKGNGKSKKPAIEQDAVEDPPAKKFEDAQKLHVPVSLRCPAPGTFWPFSELMIARSTYDY